MKKTFKNLNIDVLLKILILAIYGVSLGFLLVSNRILKYVHPRNILIMKFAFFLLVFMIIALLPDLFKKNKKTQINLSILIYIMPLLFVSYLPENISNNLSVSSKTAVSQREMQVGLDAKNEYKVKNRLESKDEIYGQYNIEEDRLDDEKGFIIEEATDLPGASDDQVTEHDTSLNYYEEGVDIFAEKRSKLKLTNGDIIIEDEDYVTWLDEIYINMDKYIGKNIRLKGFVFKDDSLEDTEFGLGRMMMVCCAADMQPVGIICRYKNAADFSEGIWLDLEGKIEEDEFEGAIIPVIRLTNYTEIVEPEMSYVYPF